LLDFNLLLVCNTIGKIEWCSRGGNLRDRDLAQISRPRPGSSRLETSHFSDGN